MVNFSKLVLLVGSACLINPVMAEDDGYGDGDYAAAPVVYKYEQKQVVKKADKPVVQNVIAESIDEDDDGDYSAAPVVYKKEVTSQPKVQVKARQEVKPQASKVQHGNYASADAVAARAKWNNRSTIAPFE